MVVISVVVSERFEAPMGGIQNGGGALSGECTTDVSIQSITNSLPLMHARMLTSEIRFTN